MREQEVERHDLRRRLHLRQHDLLEPLAGAADDLEHVEGRPLGVPRVDADTEDLLAPVLVADGAHDLAPRRLLLERGDGVLEIEEHHVGQDAGTLAEHLLARAGDRQAGAAGEAARALGHAGIVGPTCAA